MFSHPPKLKVTIADSSSYSRLVLSSMLQAQPDLEVLDTAADELSLMASLRLQKPDVLLADLNLQHTASTFCLRQIQLETGVPVLMLCQPGITSDASLRKARKLGVYDYILKPAHRLQPKLRDLQNEILTKIRAVPAAGTLGRNFQNAMVSGLKSQGSNKRPAGLVVIGASTGGTQAVESILRNLEPGINACILVAVHLPAGFTRSFAKRLQSLTGLKVVEGANGRKVEKGKIIIAPGGKNMVLLPLPDQPGRYEVKITEASETEYDKPSIDTLMRSVAGTFKGKTLGVVLTGMGKDGTKGLEALKKSCGQTLAQDQASSVIFGMAKSAIEKGHVQVVLPLAQIPGYINRFVAELPAVAQALPSSF